MEINKKLITQDTKDKILREKLQNVTFPLNNEDNEKVEIMKHLIDIAFEGKAEEYDIPAGIAIAANQVNLNKRIIYVHFEHNGVEYKYLLANPKIISFSKIKSYLPSGEGCLSVKKNHEGIVPRYLKVIVEAIDMFKNEPIKIEADGLLSINLQHEIDHLDGILYYDRINKKDPFFVEEDWVKVY